MSLLEMASRKILNQVLFNKDWDDERLRDLTNKMIKSIYDKHGDILRSMPKYANSHESASGFVCRTLKKMNDDGCHNWGRIFTSVAFIKCIDEARIMSRTTLLEVACVVLDEIYGDWIIGVGGWEAALTHFRVPNNDEELTTLKYTTAAFLSIIAASFFM